MINNFAPYIEALELKELGLNDFCLTYYKNDQLSDILEFNKNSELKNVNNEVDDYISAPTFTQVFIWFRDKHNLDSFVFGFDKGFGYEICKEGITQTNESFNSYEEAEIACLRKLIEIVKNKNNE